MALYKVERCPVAAVYQFSRGKPGRRHLKNCCILFAARISGLGKSIFATSNSTINMNEMDNNTAVARTLLGPRYHHPILLPKPVPTKILDILDSRPTAQHITQRGKEEISDIHRVTAEPKSPTDSYSVPNAPAAEERIVPTIVESQPGGDYRGSRILDICGGGYHHTHCGCGDTGGRVQGPRTFPIQREPPARPIVYDGTLEYEHSNCSWNHNVPLSNNDTMHYYEYGTQHPTVLVGDYRCRPLFCGDRCGLCPCIQGRLPARH